ncbi:unnamed protein product [Moneuplotes crassus]|uniref:Uncharacterized protein n=1 Tax=Euplotes crassus TaxID=5936 RepID=A0AAD1TYX4_EUPCR|nr:unnamed protein product [Moneuplotes crassus]
MGEAKFFRVQEPSYRYEMRSSSHLKPKTTAGKYIQDIEMDRLALPKNMDEKAASLVSKRLSMNVANSDQAEVHPMISRKRSSLNPIITIDFESLKRRDDDSDSNEALTPMTKMSKRFYKNKNRINPLTTTKSVRTLKKKIYNQESKKKIRKDLEKFEEYWKQSNQNGSPESSVKKLRKRMIPAKKITLIKCKPVMTKRSQDRLESSEQQTKFIKKLIGEIQDNSKSPETSLNINSKPQRCTLPAHVKTRTMSVPDLKENQVKKIKNCLKSGTQMLKAPLYIRRANPANNSKQLQKGLTVENPQKKWTTVSMGSFSKIPEGRNIKEQVLAKNCSVTQRNSVEKLPMKLKTEGNDDLTSVINGSETMLSHELATRSNTNHTQSRTMSRVSNKNKMFKNISANVEKIKFECMLHHFEAKQEKKEISAARSALELGKDWKYGKVPQKSKKKSKKNEFKMRDDEEIIWDLIGEPDPYGAGDEKMNNAYLKNRIITKYNKTFKLTRKKRMHQQSLNIKY